MKGHHVDDPHVIRTALRALAGHLPAVKRLLAQRDALLVEQGSLRGERDALLTERDALRADLERRPGHGVPTYDADYLTVWHKDPSFLREARFTRAYQAGMNSGHHILRPQGSDEDIHIEWRVAVCCWAAWHATHLAGDFVECGTNTGMYSLAICRYLDFNELGRSFYLFDTFRGIPIEQILQEELDLGRAADSQLLFSECYEIAKRNFAPFPRVQLIRGRVPESLGSVAIDQVCYLSIDMNIAIPERAALEHFWPKLVSGAPVILDDYGWSGHFPQKRTADEFAASRQVKILTLPTGQGLLLKP
jgi:hypothetical protein